jgi:cytochrome P450
MVIEVKAPTLSPNVDPYRKIESFADARDVLRYPQFVTDSDRASHELFASGTVVQLDAEAHTRRRRFENVLFDRDALLRYDRQALAPLVDSCIQSAAQTCVVSGEPANLVQLVRRMIHRIVADAIGLDGIDSDEDVDRFITHAEMLTLGIALEWSIGELEETTATALAARGQFVSDLYAKSRDRRRALVADAQAGRLNEADLPVDLITLLERNRDDSWDSEQPLREVALFVAAGTATTTNALPHAISHLEDWVEENPSYRDKTSDVDFLRSVAYETLRLHASTPALLRRANVDVELRSGTKISAGERVAVVVPAANRDEAVFGPTAGCFDPTRGAGEGVMPWGLTFGGGPHLCIGRPLVTGLPVGRNGEPEIPGSMLRMLTALYAHGVRRDPDNPPRRRGLSYHDGFDTFPVLLDA